MSTVKHAVIAAAGLGSRLGMGKPKCLIEFNHVTILEHQLQLLQAVEDVRIVVGFEEHIVIDLAKSIRPDVIIVRNPGYRTTTTLNSYLMGASGLKDSCLFMDGDILFNRKSFNNFLTNCIDGKELVGITQAKTKDAVFVHLNNKNQITNFSRTEKSDYEWANIVWIKPEYFENPEGPVFERLASHLPLGANEIISYEVDTVEDLKVAHEHINELNF